MKVVIKIGYDSFLLPDDKGITTVVRALTRAVACRDHRPLGGQLEIHDNKPVSVEMRYLSPGEKIKYPKEGARE